MYMLDFFANLCYNDDKTTVGIDQDWGIYGGMYEGDPSATARQWCASTPSWAQAEGKPLPKPGQPEEP